MARKSKKAKKYILLILLLICIIVFLKFINKPKNSFSEDIIVLLNNQEINKSLEDKIILNNSKVFMSFNDVKNIFDDTLYYEEPSSLIIATGNKKLAAFNKDDSKIIINGSYREGINMILNIDEKIYINISELEDVYNYETNYIKESNIITIDNLNKKAVKAKLKRKSSIKYDKKFFSRTIEKLEKGSEVIIINEENSKFKIRTKSGNLGYIKKNRLENIETIRDDYIEEEHTFSNENFMEYDITKKDISNFTKRLNIINLILQQAVKNDKMYVKIINKNNQNFEYERFKVESKPMLEECGITIKFD